MMTNGQTGKGSNRETNGGYFLAHLLRGSKRRKERLLN